MQSHNHNMLKIDHTTYVAHAKNFRQRFLILHYTAINFELSIAALTGNSVSAHYLIPTLREIDPSYTHDDLIAYNLVPEGERAWHAGVSSWGERSNLNDTSIGIEIVNIIPDAQDAQFTPYPDAQIDVVIELCRNILERYPDITPANVLGHSDIAIGRKKDPGPLFPWFRLYEAGIGAWFVQDVMLRYNEEFNKQMPATIDVIDKLKQYGYNTNVSHEDLFSAFQMHFRPCDYSGRLDAETAAIAYALCDEYYPRI